MATIRFGAACDGEGCTVAFNDYTTGTIRACEDCGKDLCPECAEKTGHVVGRETCCNECPAESWEEPEMHMAADHPDRFEGGGY